jgi:hypothetical protein
MMMDADSNLVGRRAMYSRSGITATAIPIRIGWSYVRECGLAWASCISFPRSE